MPGSSGADPVAAVYRRALPQVYGNLLPRCGSAVVAEDLTAETFMAAVATVLYRDLLGFEVELRPSPAFAMLYRGDLRLLLSVPGGGQGGGAAMPDGTLAEPGGWNRIALQVEDLPAAVEELRGKSAHFRNDIVTGVGVRQILIEDPSGNPIELFEPLAAYHERTAG